MNNQTSKTQKLSRMSLRAISDKTGLDPAYLSRVFNGQSIGERTIARLAIGLNLSKSEAYRQVEEIRATKRNESNPHKNTKASNS